MVRLGLAALAVAWGGPARADERPGLAYDPAIDLPVTAVAAATALGVKYGYKDSPSNSTQLSAEPSGLDVLTPRRKQPVYGDVSDGFLYTSMVAGVVVPVLTGIANGRWWKHALLYAEALAISLSLTEVFKFAIRRPRPYTLTERTGELNDDLSFFSGHAATTGTVLFYAASAIDLAYDLPLWARITLYGGAGALTAAVSVLRVAAGAHYPSDVIVGAVVGGSIGVLVPQLHRLKGLAVTPTLVPGGAAVSVAGTF